MRGREMKSDSISAAQYRQSLQKGGKKRLSKGLVGESVETGNSSIIMYITPLSVNAAWRGQRFKTDAYKSFETLYIKYFSTTLLLYLFISILEV